MILAFLTPTLSTPTLKEAMSFIFMTKFKMLLIRRCMFGKRGILRNVAFDAVIPSCCVTTRGAVHFYNTSWNSSAMSSHFVFQTSHSMRIFPHHCCIPLLVCHEKVCVINPCCKCSCCSACRKNASVHPQDDRCQFRHTTLFPLSANSHQKFLGDPPILALVSMFPYRANRAL